MTHQIRVGIYTRVSTDLQEKDHTVLSQLEALRTYAQEHCYPIADEYIDDGYSGATLERPGLNRLRDALRADAPDVVLFHPRTAWPARRFIRDWFWGKLRKLESG